MHWLVGFPLVDGSANRTWDTLQKYTVYDQDLSLNHKLNIPDLRVGTLDTLMQLSDDLYKVNNMMEAVVNKIRRQLVELATDGASAVGSLSVDGQSGEDYMVRFKWDEARFPTRRSLKEVVEMISESMGKVEDDLKVKAAEYNQTRAAYSAVQRKTTGSLAVRDVALVVNPEDVVDTENLTTLFAVVNKANKRNWYDSYETLCGYVVPRSSQELAEDREYVLLSVVLFKRVADEFKQNAKARGFQVKEVRVAAGEADKAPEAGAITQSLEELHTEMVEQRQALDEWCRETYGEALSSWIHVCVVRLFVESVLRYGLPPSFATFVVKPHAKQEGKLRSKLAMAFSSYDEKYYQDDKDMGVGGQEAEMYPYVSFTIDIDQ